VKWAGAAVCLVVAPVVWWVRMAQMGKRMAGEWPDVEAALFGLPMEVDSGDESVAVHTVEML
jgi:hypothetical protein